MKEIIYSVSDFIVVFNQVIDTAFGSTIVKGEVANYKISKNKWVYFDLKDEYSSIRFFGTIYQLPGPIENGMLLIVRGLPQLHPKFGFSITIQSIQLSGEGTIQKSALLLEAKLKKEGLFDVARKRALPYPPEKIGLITSGESAAYADFIKIINQRWGGLELLLYDIQVQGERAPHQITKAIEYFNEHGEVDVIVITRGGGSAEDLQAFSTEQVTRAVAASRIPTLVAIGHEVDVSLAELAADKRASTPSNAAELLTPDKRHETQVVMHKLQNLNNHILQFIEQEKEHLLKTKELMYSMTMTTIEGSRQLLYHTAKTLELLNPTNVLSRGYAIVRQQKKIVSSVRELNTSKQFSIQFNDGETIVPSRKTKVIE